MTHQEMADALKAEGWLVERPWTKENCKHPPLMKTGQGSMRSDGSGSMYWRCQLCGKSESYEVQPNPNMHLMFAHALEVGRL